MRKIFKYLIFSLLLLTTTFTLFSCQSTNVDKDDDKIEDNNNSGNGDKDDPTEENPDSNTDDYPTTIYNSNITNYGKVGYEATYLGTVERKLPDISNEGLLKYPEYGVKFTGPEEEKQAILAESDYLIASNNTYNKMDKDGNIVTSWKPFENLFDYKGKEIGRNKLKDAKQNWMRLNLEFYPTGYNKVDALYE